MISDPSQNRDSADQSDRAGINLEPDAFTAALGPSVSAVAAFDRPGASIFFGLLSDDDDETQVRLYQDYELRTYVRLARDDILQRQHVTNQAGVKVSIVWVRKNATVEIRELVSEELQADLLSGALLVAERAQASGEATDERTAIITTTITPPVTLYVCTRVFCTNFTCACTARHSALCSIICAAPPAPGVSDRR